MKSLLELLASLQSQLAVLSDLQASYDADVKTAFDAGVASVVCPASDKLYSQEELDAAIAAAIAALPPVTASSDKIYSQAELDESVKVAIAALKAGLLAAEIELLK